MMAQQAFTYKDESLRMSQYGEEVIPRGTIVNAVYIPARIKKDKDNPFIRALPLPRDSAAVIEAYTKTIDDYDYEATKGREPLDNMLEIGRLKDLRFMLPFHSELEFMFYEALITSYRARAKKDAGEEGIAYTANDKREISESTLEGSNAEATNAGFSLIGYSGCGKSSSIDILTSRYPQAIKHTDENGHYIQITYLIVSCIPNSNFSAIYQGIGRAIDKALGNRKPCYELEIERTNGLAKKQEKVREYIERFAIGIIIFDEIQLIDFSHTKENTFEALLTLANETKVAMAVVGTEDAKDKMFSQLRTGRRLGETIIGNYYCSSYEFFSMMVDALFEYQWFDEWVVPDDEIKTTLYDITNGIVDQLISIYSSICNDYINSIDKPEKIDAKYIRDVANEHYAGTQELIKKMKDAEPEDVEIKMQEAADKARQDYEMTRIMAMVGKSKGDDTKLMEKVIDSIMKVNTNYTPALIRPAFEKVMKKKDSDKKSLQEINELVLKELSKAPARKGKGKNATLSDEELTAVVGF